MQIALAHIEALPEVAQHLLTLAAGRKTWFFHGRIGAGKTTLIQELCRQLGVTDEVTSPTYALVNEYAGKEHTIYHLDLYRLNELEEAFQMGIEEYLYSDAYCFVEWPELIASISTELDPFVIRIEIADDSTRNILLLED